VDDTIIAFHKEDKDEWFQDKKSIGKTFSIKDMGECNWILNMKVIRNRVQRTITLSQQAYVERILKQFALHDNRTVHTPMDSNHLLWKTMDNYKYDVIPLTKEENELYRSLVGALLYLANTTRIDITYAVGQLCRYTSKACVHHIAAAKRVLKYLKDTPDLCMIFGQNGSTFTVPKIEAYCDSDWAGDKVDGKSTTGCVIRFNGDVMNWLSKKQTSVAMSTAEAEYIAAGEAVKELLWYRSWISEVFHESPIGIVHCDNTAAISLTDNDTIHDRSKHIRLRYHFIRDEISKKHISIRWIKTIKQQADILTKPLEGAQFTRIRDKLLSLP